MTTCRTARVATMLIVALLPVALLAQYWTPLNVPGTSPIGYTGDVHAYGVLYLGGDPLQGSTLTPSGKLVFWPHPSGPYIAGSSDGLGLEVTAMGGTIHLLNGNTLIEGWEGSSPATNTALTVKGSTSASANGALKVINSANTSLVFVRNDGFVGFGTTTPQARINAYAPTGAVAIRVDNGDFPGTNATMAIDNVIGPYLISHSDTAGLATAPYAAHRVTFGASTFAVAYSPATAVSQQRTWTNHLVVDTAGKVGIGRDAPAAALDVNGDVLVSGTLTAQHVIGAQYQDIAEWVPASEAMRPGTVVVIDPRSDNGVVPSGRAYDTSVAGVVSAQPGFILGTAGPSKEQIATTGRVKVHVDASRGPIRLGDLLVSSDKPGVAMRSEPIDLGGQKLHRPGTIIGKALQPLASGEGEILVLLSLQ
jgi:hypothetical protein